MAKREDFPATKQRSLLPLYILHTTIKPLLILHHTDLLPACVDIRLTSDTKRSTLVQPPCHNEAAHRPGPYQHRNRRSHQQRRHESEKREGDPEKRKDDGRAEGEKDR